MFFVFLVLLLFLFSFPTGNRSKNAHLKWLAKYLPIFSQSKDNFKSSHVTIFSSAQRWKKKNGIEDRTKPPKTKRRLKVTTDMTPCSNSSIVYLRSCDPVNKAQISISILKRDKGESLMSLTHRHRDNESQRPRSVSSDSHCFALNTHILLLVLPPVICQTMRD